MVEILLLESFDSADQSLALAEGACGDELSHMRFRGNFKSKL